MDFCKSLFLHLHLTFRLEDLKQLITNYEAISNALAYF